MRASSGWALVALAIALPAAAAHALTQDITSQFAITRSGLVLNRTTNTFDSTVTLKNTSSAPVLAPIDVVVGGLPSRRHARQQGRRQARWAAVRQSDGGGLAACRAEHAHVRAQVRQSAARDVHQHAADSAHVSRCRRTRRPCSASWRRAGRARI